MFFLFIKSIIIGKMATYNIPFDWQIVGGLVKLTTEESTYEGGCAECGGKEDSDNMDPAVDPEINIVEADAVIPDLNEDLTYDPDAPKALNARNLQKKNNPLEEVFGGDDTSEESEVEDIKKLFGAVFEDDVTGGDEPELIETEIGIMY